MRWRSWGKILVQPSTMIRLGDPTPFCAFCSKVRIVKGQRTLVGIRCGNVTFESFTRMEIRLSNS